jgi:hypothetical protein
VETTVSEPEPKVPVTIESLAAAMGFAPLLKTYDETLSIEDITVPKGPINVANALVVISLGGSATVTENPKYKGMWQLYFVSKEWHAHSAGSKGLHKIFSSYFLLEPKLHNLESQTDEVSTAISALQFTHYLLLPIKGTTLSNMHNVYSARGKFSFVGSKATGATPRPNGDIMLSPYISTVVECYMNGAKINLFRVLTEAMAFSPARQKELMAWMSKSQTSIQNYLGALSNCAGDVA